MAWSDLEYYPVLGDVPTLVADRPPDCVLIVGTDVPDYVSGAGSSRWVAAGHRDLPTGAYRFSSDGAQDLMVVVDGALPGIPTSASWDETESPLAHAYGWYRHLWETAIDIPKPTFPVGSEVRVAPSGQEGVVRTRFYVSAGWSYEVRVEGRTIQVREQALSAPERDDDPTAWISRPPAPARRFAATLTRAKLREQLSDTLFSFRASRTLFRAYQFRPVMRLLATDSLHLLIADEVGLGKTIEAGLVWTELDARAMANRVLVVCPSMLLQKWRLEMEERFGFELVELGRRELDDMLQRIEEDRLPTRFHVVCSLERLRTWPGLQRLEEIGPRFDLVIADEAHAFRNVGTRSFKLGKQLAKWSGALVFLSATPLNLGNDDLFNLLSLLDQDDEFTSRALLEQQLEPNAVLNRVVASLLDRSVDNGARLSWLAEIDAMTFAAAVTSRPEFAELETILREPELTHADVVSVRRLVARLHSLSAVVTRTRKVEIDDRKAVREARKLDVKWTPAEEGFYNAFQAWQYESARRRDIPVGFATQMPLRLASSCLPAARRQLLRDYRTLAEDDLDPSDDEDIVGDLLEPPPELMRAAHQLGEVDTKFDQFLPTLSDIVGQDRQVLVFTFSRRTLAYLEERLSSLFRIAVLHGDVAREERHRIIGQFRAGAYQVLLASRVASEGLDFEFCSAVVNYDLPWNPMEVEQRIGRVDRFGQRADKILILNFETPGTIESDIVLRLMHRIGVFKDSIGDLEPILQSEMATLRRIVFDPELSVEQRNQRLDAQLAAIEEQRRTLQEVDSARAYLSSTDNAEIDGLEGDLLSSGRYVGQAELVLLIEDWAAICPGARCSVSTDGRRLLLRGTREMAQHLRGVQARGDRSAAEVERLAQKLRDEQEVVVSLDQELARTTGEELLSANHPLTRGALLVAPDAQARFANLKVRSATATPGRYLVLLSVARWKGLRSSRELWTSVVSTDGSGQVKGDAVGDALLAALATGSLIDGDDDLPDCSATLERARSALRRHHAVEEERRFEENRALIESRRISVRETHARRVQQIEQRIESLRASGNERMIRPFEAQLNNQARLLEDKLRQIDAAHAGSLTVEALATCVVEVVA